MGRSGVVYDFLLALLVFGIWKVSAQRQCPKLQKPWNGQFVGGCNRHIGAECQFACREPYRLVGSRVRLCRTDRTWSGQTSACELDVGCTSCGGCNNCGGCSNNCNYGDSSCPALYSPDGGHTDGQCIPGVVGQSCVFHCNSGYVLQGPATITCLSNGQWNAQTPHCRRSSGAICESFVIPNGEATCDLEVGVTVCRATCHPGYMLVGSSVITCSSSGSWNEQFPVCRRGSPEVTNICPTLVAPDGGRLVGSCSAANTGDTCQLVCISGYRPSDTRVLVCQTNGQWSSTLPRCINSGCPSIQVPYGTTSGTCDPGNPGQSCTITCQAGYTLAGNPTIYCQTNGQWSSAIPSCTVRSCPVLPAPANGGTSGSCSPGSVGQSCSFYCNGGYNLVGQASLVCGNDGRWSGTAPLCTAGTCTALRPPQNGDLSGSCSQASVGQSCTFSCHAGYTISGQANLYCQPGGIWSSSAPTCVVVRCPDLHPPANGAVAGHCWRASLRQSCSFSCQAGYAAAGQSNLYCEKGGRWSGNAPTCARVTPLGCSSLVAPNNGHMQGTCSPGRVGQTCVFSCDYNFVLRGQRTLTCQSGGRWSDYTPLCERIESEGGSCPILTPPPHGDFEECDNRAGGRCIVVCEQGYLRSGSRVRTCLSGGVWSGFAPTCTRKVGYTTTYTYKVVPLWSLVFG